MLQISFFYTPISSKIIIEPYFIKNFTEFIGCNESFHNFVFDEKHII
jgi:hypothetical protein